jgi:hypothetical protein
MLDLTIRLRSETDAAPAAREASSKLSQEDWRTLVAFAQALCVQHEALFPEGLIVLETRRVARPDGLPNPAAPKLPVHL